MMRSRSFFLTVSLALLLPVATGVLWSAVVRARSDDRSDSLYKYLTIFSEALGLVRSSYVDAVDPDVLLAGALDGVTDALDPFSSLVPPEAATDYERARDLSTRRSGLTLARDHGIAFVVAVEEGSPAAEAGLERGDLIAEIGGFDSRRLPIWRVERRLAGEPGETVALRILRGGEPEEREITLADATPPAPRIERVDGTPMLRIPRIDASAVGPVRDLLAGLAANGESRLLVDLRELSGGEMAAAYELGALFASGDLGRLAERDRTVREFRSDLPPAWRGRLVTLVDGGTLGAAEILAAVLRDGAGAQLVGVPTFGWAGRLGVRELSGGARLHLTTAFYSGPSGEAISTRLRPDELVDGLSRSLDDSERPLDELILERGLEVLGRDDAGERRAA